MNLEERQDFSSSAMAAVKMAVRRNIVLAILAD